MRVHLNKQKGQAIVEYSLLVALIAVVAIAVMTLLGSEINETFNETLEAMRS